MSSDTTRSSVTVIESDRRSANFVDHDLEREIAREEKAFESYGGDDPHEPPDNKDEEQAEVNMVTWDGPDDPTNPHNWSKPYKWFITVICCVMTVNVTFASSAPTSASTHIAKEFGVSAEISYLITTLFLIGYVVGPMIWGPGSELLGRRPIFWVAMTCYTLFHLGQALAPNMETLLVTRFFAGVFAVAPLTNCGGVIADIWDAAGRGLATSLFVACVFVGPVLGPIVAGYIVESYLGWRWVFWIMMIFAGTCTVIMLFTLPETFAPVILQNKARRLRRVEPERNQKLYAEHERLDWSFSGVIHRTIYRPFYMLYKEPILVLVTIYISVVYGVLYALFEAFPVIFIEKRHFTIAQNGLIFIGVGIGSTIGSLLNMWFSLHYPRLIKEWKGFPPPEERLYGAMLAGPSLVIGVFWLGWTGQYPSVPWYVPAIGTILIGMSVALIFVSLLAYLIDTYLMYSSSAFAVNTMIRSAVAAAFPLFTVQMFTKLGVNWASTLLGIIGIVLTPSPFLFYKFGARIRAGSTFAPGIDLRIAKELELEKQAGTA
ncbi:hypothetical protein PILCRDRAFT_822775 [Piloderma croceum F 1598]|uniref:Major facilitator superfamily (MFS) profile domain-containing protein n=1 Tax=Piloderma croceum (strain F 1598) TaxID=765440 RepID=A0A0C3FK39_PILCF|nr:hypothetical protein PILCRDRAFT_822775 [Piloderma croceum F 1598]